MRINTKMDISKELYSSQGLRADQEALKQCARQIGAFITEAIMKRELPVHINRSENPFTQQITLSVSVDVSPLKADYEFNLEKHSFSAEDHTVNAMKQKYQQMAQQQAMLQVNPPMFLKPELIVGLK